MEMFLLVATLALSVGIGWMSRSLPQLAADPGGPGLFPFAAACVTGVACLLLMGQRLFAEVRVARTQTARAMVSNAFAQSRAKARQWGVVLLVLVFPLMIDWIGFVAAVFLFGFSTLLVSGKQLATAALASVLITAGVYVAYAMILGAVLPRGQLIYQLFY